jgi:hypothetical protein
MTKKIIKWLSEHFLLPLCVSGILFYFSFNYLSLKPAIAPMIWLGTADPYVTFKTPLNLNYEKDSVFPVYLIIENTGNKQAELISTHFEIKDKNKILTIKSKYIPKQLERKILDQDKDKPSVFYEEIKFLPQDAIIQYTLNLQSVIKTEDDYILNITSKEKDWTKNIQINPNPKFNLSVEASFIFSKVYANEVETKATPKAVTSGILIGGYDPIVMSNGLFILLQNKKIISNQEATEIIKILKSYKHGILFGGINFAKFNELVLSILLTKKIISNEEVREILKKSQNAGGILMNGYNIIILEVGILNALLLNNTITLQEGQSVIDKSKPKKENKNENK